MNAWRAVLVAVSVLCANSCFCAAEKVIFDTDIGGDVDDALALAYLACNPQCELLGVTVEGWNSLKQAEIASAICHNLGRGEIPIHAGCNAPMLTSAHYSGALSDDPRYWPIVTNRPHRTFERIDAVEFLRDAIRRNPGKITLIATGQYTNLGVLFSRYPELPGQLKRLVLMGGRSLKGGGEWNASTDPVATAVVFGNGCHSRPPETLVFDACATQEHHLPPVEARRFMAGLPALALCAEAAEYWYRDCPKGLFFHDPMAAVAAFHPEIAQYTNCTVTVDVSRKVSRIDAVQDPAKGVLKIATDVSFPAFTNAFVQPLRPCAIRADFDKTSGRIHAVHGIGQGPLQGACDFSLFKYLKDAGIPYARLHDVGGWLGKEMFVDIPNLFPDFDADENDPANYCFAFTDRYLKALIDNGVEPYFRLGVTIENWVRDGLPPKRIYPPKDFAKWARICEHVIRHYTEGWADGYRWKITYWEIWNEADDYPPRNCMWLGTWRQFCELYDVTAKHLKACFPHLKIGGYGKCSAHNVTFRLRADREYEPRNEGDDWAIAANTNAVPECEMFIHRAFVEFLDYAKAHRTPIDFFSFHGYIRPELVGPHTDYHRALLAKAGYGDVELHLNEWLCGRRERFGYQHDAAFAAQLAAFLVEMQKNGIAVGNVYDGSVVLGRYSPLFDPIELKPGRTLGVFKFFDVLYRLGEEVPVETSGAVRAVAAKKGEDAALYLVNATPAPRRLNLKLGPRRIVRCRLTDQTHDAEDVAFDGVMSASSVMLIELK